MTCKLREIRSLTAHLRYVTSWGMLIWQLKQIWRVLTWTPPREEGQATGVTVVSLFVVGLVTLGIVQLAIQNQAHANMKHMEAPQLRKIVRKHNKVELWFSPKRGTVMALFLVGSEASPSPQYGGIIWKVTENRGQRWLGNNAYECTAFQANRHYWDGVIRRDSYVPIASHPDIRRQFLAWIRANL